MAVVGTSLMPGPARSNDGSSAEAPIAILFANLKGNLGDFAILHAMLLDLSRKHPSKALRVYSHPLHEIDHGKLDVFRGSAPKFELMGKSWIEKSGVLQGMRMQATRLPRLLAGQIRSFSKQFAAYSPEFSGYGAVYMAGGDQWSGRKLGLCMLGTVEGVSRLNRNIGAYPFSVKESIRRTYPSGFLAEIFQCFTSPIVARDRSSQGILRQLGVEARAAVDSAYLLSPLCLDLKGKAGRDPRRVLLVAKGEPRAIEVAGKRLLEAGVPIELLTTCEPEDGPGYRRAARALGVPLVVPQTWQDVVAEMKSSQLIITNRLHGLILGTFADVPLLPIVDRAKARAFASDVGLRHTAKSLDDLSAADVQAALRDAADSLNKIKVYRNQSKAALDAALAG